MEPLRNIHDGGWYWVSKTIIQEYPNKIGFLPLAVYHLLASMTDERQSCYPSQQYIAARLGCSRSSVSRAVKTLIAHRLITLTEGERSQRVYRLLSVKGCAGGIKVSHPCNSDVAPVDTNNTCITRLPNNVVSVSSLHSEKKDSGEFQPETKEELLASDIAVTLDDECALPKYLSYAKRYPESLLREALSMVKQTPSRKIKKSRAALFAYLLNRYGQRTA